MFHEGWSFIWVISHRFNFIAHEGQIIHCKEIARPRTWEVQLTNPTSAIKVFRSFNHLYYYHRSLRASQSTSLCWELNQNKENQVTKIWGPPTRSLSEKSCKGTGWCVGMEKRTVRAWKREWERERRREIELKEGRKGVIRRERIGFFPNGHQSCSFIMVSCQDCPSIPESPWQNCWDIL